MATISVKDIHVLCAIGQAEHPPKHPITIDVSVIADVELCVINNALSHMDVDIEVLVGIVRTVPLEKRYTLIEALIRDIAGRIVKKFLAVREVEVRVKRSTAHAQTEIVLKLKAHQVSNL